LAIKSLRIEPTEDLGRYRITPGSEVGVIALPELAIAIEPKLPVDRVMFLISYSIGGIRWNSAARLPTESGLVEWLVPMFAQQAQQAFARGLAQGYRTEETALATIRGRIRFDDQLRRRFDNAPPIEVRFDEFTEDIELNRLVKAAVRRLQRLRLRRDESRLALTRLEFALERVSDVTYHPRLIPRPQFNRLNEHYRHVVDLSRLVLASSTLALGTNGAQGTAFLVDMNRVFEDFVVTALRETLSLSRQQFPQGAAGRSLFLARDRVRLKPDISWWEDGRCVFVGDVKYKRLDLAGYRHADLYQVLAYSTATDLPGGILIYAKGERPSARYRVPHADKTLEVIALSLDGSPDEILAEIAEVATRVRLLRRSARRLSAA
jgi:5-methylcytosine-specific restriction enzyme subunit McrC